jgi:hypothetical protein
MYKPLPLLESNMKKIFIIALASALTFGIADAKPGGGGGGGGHVSSGGFSSGGSKGSFSAPSAAPRPAPNFAPHPAPAGPPPTAQKGSFSAPPPAAAPRQTTTTTSTTTMTRRTAGGGYAGSPMMYGGMGMGFGYSNGLLTGLIIGNMMHPHNTVVYSGGGYNGNALLYPDGRVVNQQGYQVGTYQDGQFNAVNGGMVAQAAPADALTYQSSTQPMQTTPVVIKTGPSAIEIFGYVLGSILIILLIIVLLGVL